MSKKGGNFLEANIEKIVIGIVALACVWLFISRLVLSPNKIKYEGKSFSPGKIDTYIYEKAQLLSKKLKNPPEPAPERKEQNADFIAVMNSAVRDVDLSLYPPIPPCIAEQEKERRYSIPKINNVENVKVEHIRAVAYVPLEDISEQQTYDNVQAEPNDLDLVSVEAKLNVEQLFDNFHESFAGPKVQQSWRDPCLATPVFAAVELQRQLLLPDGNWSGWQVIPRTKIDNRKIIFQNIEDVDKLPPGGLKVRLLQFNNPILQKNLLQPQAYAIASTNEEWFPPSLHRKYLYKVREMQLLERREEREKAKEERDREREQARTERLSRMSEQKKPATQQDGFTDSGSTLDDSTTRTSRTTLRQTRLERLKEREQQKQEPQTPQVPGKPKSTIADIYQELDDILLKSDTDFSQIRQPLTFWAHDDTVEAGKTYRYRIRIGVFNPIAGTEQLEEKDQDLKNKVILWSEFSNPTTVVQIPKVLYFFATKVQEAVKRAEVTVCRYVLGHWYEKSFPVHPGEAIGTIANYQPLETETDAVVPNIIDYSTGSVMIDIVSVKDWQKIKTLRQRHYTEMLYSYDGVNIEHMPVGMRFWDEDTKSKFNEISTNLKQAKQPWRPRGTQAFRTTTTTPSVDELPMELSPKY
jgi:hypothetical protein